MTAGRVGAVVLAVVVASVLWMSWPLPVVMGEVWTSARLEGDLAWSLLLHDWTTDVLIGQGQLTADSRTWSPDGGSLPRSAWNLVALLSTAWLGIDATPLTAWHRSMLFIGVLNGLGGGWLGWRVGGAPGAMVAAVACACAPTAWFELGEGRLEQGLIAPLALWLAEAWALTRRPLPELAGLALGLVAATYWFLGPIGLLAGLVLPFIGPDRTVPLRQQSPVRWGAGLLILLVVVGLAWLPVSEAARAGLAHGAASDPMLSRVQRLTSSVPPRDLLFGGALPAHRLPVVAALLVPAAASWPAVRPWLVCAAVGAVLAAGSVWSLDGEVVLVGGMELSLPLRALDLLPGFSRFWWPDRIIAVVMVAAAGGLAAAAGAMDMRRGWLLAVVLALGWAADGRVQLRSAIREGDPRIPPSSLDPAPHRGFFAPPVVVSQPRPLPEGAVLVGPWSTTANLIPLVALQTGQPLLRGDGAADRRLWPADFAHRVDQSSLLTALFNDTPLPEDSAAQLDRLGVSTVVWRGEAPEVQAMLACAPETNGEWQIWDRTREACR